ncbi:hypothetical protein COOONC_10258 [Cooperia oncophora]
MRKSESAHPNICSLDIAESKPRIRSGKPSVKPPPPVKPEGLSQRVKALSPNPPPVVTNSPVVVNVTPVKPAAPSSTLEPVEQERTEDRLSGELKNVPSISRTPSSSRWL